MLPITLSMDRSFRFRLKTEIHDDPLISMIGVRNGQYRTLKQTYMG